MPSRRYLTRIDLPSIFQQGYVPDEYMPSEVETAAFDRDAVGSDMDSMHRSGMPHRSGLGDYGGRHADIGYISAQEMADLQRSGMLEDKIRRIQQAKADARRPFRPSPEPLETPAPYDPRY